MSPFNLVNVVLFEKYPAIKTSVIEMRFTVRDSGCSGLILVRMAENRGQNAGFLSA